MRVGQRAPRSKVPPDITCALLAGAQLGALSREQALSAGVTASGISRRIKSGKWIPVLEAVYRLAGYKPGPEQLLMAACLWAKDGVAVSHRPAAARWGLIETQEAVVEISTETRRRPPAGSGIIVHHAPLPARDVGWLGSMPVTTVTRTLIDLAAVVGEERLENALDHALRSHRTTLPRLRVRLGELGGRGQKGTGALRALIEQRDAAAATAESALESMMLRLLRRHRIRTPELQYIIEDDSGPFVARVDFAYPDVRLAIEVDGYAWHSGRREWQNDLDRANRLEALGWRLLRFSYEDVDRRAESVVAAVRRALGARGALSV